MVTRKITSQRNRGYLPHREVENGSYFVTFRLVNSIPWKVLERWKLEQELILDSAKYQRRDLTPRKENRLEELRFEKIDKYLDQGLGPCWLSVPSIAKVVVDALKYFDEQRYHLYCWSVMPNHVHSLFETIQGSDLKSILHSWKSFTANSANRILNRQGKFWQREYHDHLVRDQEELDFYMNYTLMNPVNAGLCARWQDWTWSGKKGG